MFYLPFPFNIHFQAIDKVLRVAATSSGQQAQQDVDLLRKLFIPARTRAVGQINDQLAQFRRKQHFGWE
jgi:hypothetical protein